MKNLKSFENFIFEGVTIPEAEFEEFKKEIQKLKTNEEKEKRIWEVIKSGKLSFIQYKELKKLFD